MSPASESLRAGAAVEEITPRKPVFLWGYPHVERMSTGVHDPLLSSALCLSDGATELLFVSNDVIFVSKTLAASARQRIQSATGIPAANIMITATHTHSGPQTVRYVSNDADPVVPGPDPDYLRFLEDQIVAAGLEAWRRMVPAEAGLAVARVTGIGTNRRDPSGSSELDVPVLLVRERASRRQIACMAVCTVHPTVLHEDSKLVSADFPGAARAILERDHLGDGCVFVYHTGAAGNQSPRHVVRGQTFEEAERLGRTLAEGIGSALKQIAFRSDLRLASKQATLEMKPRGFPPVAAAKAALAKAQERFETLKRAGAPRADVRTAECDLFGAEETLELATAALDGRLEAGRTSCMPAEIQVFAIGPWRFVGWMGEFFVEYALEVKARAQNTHVITLANGELQGYMATEEAAAEGGYEASNALFSHINGPRVVERTLEMLADLAT